MFMIRDNLEGNKSYKCIFIHAEVFCRSGPFPASQGRVNSRSYICVGPGMDLAGFSSNKSNNETNNYFALMGL